METIKISLKANAKKNRRYARCEKRRERYRNRNRVRTARCDSCGGQMVWCSFCKVFTKTCCVDYGTCLCS